MLQPLKSPDQYALSPRDIALAKLRAIEAIRVDKKIKYPGGSRYIIDLYMRPSPSAASTMVSPASVPRSQLVLHNAASPSEATLSREDVGNREPDAHVDKTYLDVFAFKDELATAAFSCRCAKRCRLCQSVFEFIAGIDRTPPAIVRALSTTEMKKRDIEKMINAFVGIVVRAQILTSSPGAKCEGNEKIPIMIREFLEL